MAVRKIEKRLKIRDDLELRLVKIPGKRGYISSYTDSWFVALERGTKDDEGRRMVSFITFSEGEDYETQRRVFDRFKDFLE